MSLKFRDCSTIFIPSFYRLNAAKARSSSNIPVVIPSDRAYAIVTCIVYLFIFDKSTFIPRILIFGSVVVIALIILLLVKGTNSRKSY